MLLQDWDAESYESTFGNSLVQCNVSGGVVHTLKDNDVCNFIAHRENKYFGSHDGSHWFLINPYIYFYALHEYSDENGMSGENFNLTLSKPLLKGEK